VRIYNKVINKQYKQVQASSSPILHPIAQQPPNTTSSSSLYTTINRFVRSIFIVSIVLLP
jgi:hypothetical protein